MCCVGKGDTGVADDMESNHHHGVSDTHEQQLCDNDIRPRRHGDRVIVCGEDAAGKTYRMATVVMVSRVQAWPPQLPLCVCTCTAAKGG